MRTPVIKGRIFAQRKDEPRRKRKAVSGTGSKMLDTEKDELFE